MYYMYVCINPFNTDNTLWGNWIRFETATYITVQTDTVRIKYFRGIFGAHGSEFLENLDKIDNISDSIDPIFSSELQWNIENMFLVTGDCYSSWRSDGVDIFLIKLLVPKELTYETFIVLLFFISEASLSDFLENPVEMYLD